LDSTIPGPPYVGALLRMSWQPISTRIVRELNAAGFDIAPAHMAVLQYPPPDGVRPIEIATNARISRQAVNYLIAQIEARGFLERRTVRGKGRLVFLTPAGHRLSDAAQAISCRIEAELQDAIGSERWVEFRATLVRVGELVTSDGVSGAAPLRSG
jgi:DNA-binding MarR family transcriptional regulator